MAISRQPHYLRCSAARIRLHSHIQTIPRSTVTLRYCHGRCMGPCVSHGSRKLTGRSPWDCQWDYPRRLSCWVSSRCDHQSVPRTEGQRWLARALLHCFWHIAFLRWCTRYTTRVGNIFESQSRRAR